MTVAEEMLDILGHDVMQRLCEWFGGERIYIPKHVPIPNRSERIKQDFITCLQGGATCMAAYEQLSHSYDLSVRRVQSLVAS